MYRSVTFFRFPSLAVLMAAGMAAITPVPARAQDTDGQQAESLFGTKTDITIGLAAGLDQRYLGAKDYRPLLLPVISVHQGAFFADFTRGVGMEYQSASGFYIGQAFSYDLGRVSREDDILPGSKKLAGMGDVPITATSTTTVAQQIFPWLLVSADAELGLDGHGRGNRYRIGLESEVFKTETDSLTFDFDTHIGDGRYNQTYFGVTDLQSQSSHFARFHADAGVYAYSLSASFNHAIDAHLSALLQISGTRYAGNVSDSPIIESATGVAALLSMNYAF